MPWLRLARYKAKGKIVQLGRSWDRDCMSASASGRVQGSWMRWDGDSDSCRVRNVRVPIQRNTRIQSILQLADGAKAYGALPSL